MGSFKITFLSTVYLRCWLWTYWTDALPSQEVVEQDEALLHTHQHDLLHGHGWQGQGLSKKKQKQIFISPPTGEYRKCNGGKWSRLPLQAAPTILHRHWQEKGDQASSLVEVLMLFILLMIDYVHRSTNSDSMSHEQRLSARGTIGNFHGQPSKKLLYHHRQ